MNKRVTDTRSKSKNDIEEDPEIKKVAHANNSSQFVLLLILIVLFGLTLFCALFYIGKYYETRKKVTGDAELIEISKESNKSLITNNGPFETVIDDTSSEDIFIESFANAEIETDAKSKKDGVLVFDVKYEILKNDFRYNIIPNINSDVVVRFSYSFDNEEWTSIGNVLSTTTSTINPLMSNYYDVGGISGVINVATNYRLSSKPNEIKRIYWKSETLIKNTTDTVGKTFTANLKIEYKESA